MDDERGEPDGKCQVCGKPGWTQCLRNAPTSGCFCDEHSSSFVMQPLSCLLYLALIAVAAWLAYRYLF
jgi:hypothetical protein